MKKKYLGYFLIAPTYLLFIVFFLIPVGYSFFLTFFDWNGFSPVKVFVGFENYINLVSDKNFINAFANSLVYMVCTSVLTIAVAMVFSLIFKSGVKGNALMKAAYFMPYIISYVAISVVWSWIYLPNENGLLNSVLSWFNIAPKLWLQDAKLSMPSIIAMGVWKNMGYNIVILTAGLMSISPTLYEAAKIDGASGVQAFFEITLPLLKPTLFFITISVISASLIQVFDIVNVSTRGGPVGTTEMLVTYLYKVGFKEYEIGYASAIAFVLFFFAISITIIQKKLSDKQ